MITAAEREKRFREALAVLLERHGAELDVTSETINYSTRPICRITMMSKWDGLTLIADYTDFEL